MKISFTPTGMVLASVLLMAQSSHSQVLKAEYLFNGNLASSVAGAPNLVSVDPESDNGFVSDTVYGHARTVFQWDGNSTPSQQAGLSLNTTGLVPVNSYSLEMVIDLDNAPDSAWRRLVDVQNRQSDDGFYVDPANQLDVYPVAGGGSAFAGNTYENVILTDGGGVVKAYLNGALSFSATTSVMDINNAGNLMNLFLDNEVGGGIGEVSNGKIALFSLYSGVLNQDEIDTLTGSSLPTGSSGVPDPSGTAGLLGFAVAGLAGFKKFLSRAPR